MNQFDEWMNKVDKELRVLLPGTGITHKDIPDWDYAGAFGDGMSAKEAAEEALSEDELYQAFFG